MAPLVISTAKELTGGNELLPVLLLSFLGVLNTAVVQAGPSTAASALEAFELLVDLTDEAEEPLPAGTFHQQ